MKNTKILKGISLLIVATSLCISCKKNDFADNYNDPEKITQASMEGLYPGFLYNHRLENRNTIFPRYWNMTTFQLPMLGTYTQTFGYTNDVNQGRMYEQMTAYSQDRWDYYYVSFIANFRDMERLVAAMETEEQKQGYTLFLETAKIFLYDQTAQMVDLWGHIPFYEAGSVIASQGQVVPPKYDKDIELYKFILEDLKRINTYLKDNKVPAFYSNNFKKVDLLNQGDINKWRIYANSLRLRLAMRMSYSNEQEAKAIVSEILNDPATYPVISTNSQIVQFVSRGTQLNAILGGHHGQGIKDVTINMNTSGYMINKILKPANDPRLEVMFAKNADGIYLGLDNTLPTVEQNKLITDRKISRLDSATFSRNDKFPGIVMTAAEISFFKAEANERWGVGTPAKTEYENGIQQSIAFLYYINNLNDNADGTSFTPLVAPSEATITAFLSGSTVNYTGTTNDKLEKIGTQQWLNFGLFQNYHGWAELRRTKYPVLHFVEDKASSIAKLPPSKLVLPAKEHSLNAQNYEAVKATDTPNSKVFWDVK